jgi:phosphomevalonate kinase
VEKTLKEINESKESMNKFSIWIITDARRQTDYEYFKSKYLNLVKTVRVVADESVRIERNWTFTQGNYDVIFRIKCKIDHN